MGEAGGLYADFCEALNRELAAVSCRLRIDGGKADRVGEMLVMDSHGHELGWMPDHVDAQTLLAFEGILDGAWASREAPARAQGDR